MIDKNIKTDCAKYIARIVWEAATPLAVGSGEKDIFSDALVATTANGLPYIPGTSIAGVLRHLLSEGDAERILGTQSKGSATVITDAMIVNAKGMVCDGLQQNWKEDALLACYQELPIRNHARINDKGVTVDKGKYDNKVVYKGSRFCFEIELTLRDDSEELFKEYEEAFRSLLNLLNSELFRIGSGTRCGYGEMKLVTDGCKVAMLRLKDARQLDAYLNKSAALNEVSFWKNDFICPLTQFINEGTVDHDKDKKIISYQLHLKPLNFFLFGSGGGDDDADMVPVSEKCVCWNANGEGYMSEAKILIPATSVKGAIAHRVAYYYNIKKGNFAGEVEHEQVTGSANMAVTTLFGSDEAEGMSRGNVILSDLFLCDVKGKEKILNHVTIEPFTGGGMEGHLFSEKVNAFNDVFVMNVAVAQSALDAAVEARMDIETALENALQDICNGRLPLGGGVNRGNGCFFGKLLKNGVELNREVQYENR